MKPGNARKHNNCLALSSVESLKEWIVASTRLSQLPLTLLRGAKQTLHSMLQKCYRHFSSNAGI